MRCTLRGRLAEALKGGRYDAVTVAHSETSTGALNPIAELAKVTHAAGDVVLLVDSVSGVAGVPVESDAWALDFVLTGSQKAFALPPGLAFGVAQPNILERAAAQTEPRDLLRFHRVREVHREEPDAQHAGRLAAVRAGAAAEADGRGDDAGPVGAARGDGAAHLGVGRRPAEARRSSSVLAPEGYRSWTVTCLTVPPGKKGSEVNGAMKAKGITISAGYGKLKDSTIRIGHMGEHTVAELDRVLTTLEEVLTS